MRVILCSIGIWMCTSVLAAEPTSPEWFGKDRDTVVVRAFFDNQEMLQNLVDEKVAWTVDKRKGYALINVNEFEAVELSKRGYRLELDESRTQEYHRVHTFDPNQRAGIPGFECYRTVTETFADAQALASANPGLAEWLDIGDSWEKQNGLGGSDLRVLKITNSAIAGPKPVLFAMSAIHAREYTTAETNTRFAEYLINNYSTNADVRWVLDNHEVHLSLQSNPDGREQAQTGASWRKNTNQNYCSPTSSSRGADLNRNFDFQWGCCGGSSGSQCSETYRGSSSGSEPEVAAIQDYVRSIVPDQRGPNLSDAAPSDAQGIFLDIHSFSQLVLWPWGFAFTDAPNSTALVTLGRKFAWFNGYTPQQATDLYITDGTTDDFGYGELGLAAYTFELGTTFFQNCGSFESTIYPDNLQALIYAAKAARAPYQLPAGPEIVDLTLDTNAVIAGTQVNLNATADDGRFNNSNGSEPTQNIAAVSAYIDVPPWEAGAVALPLVAADGAFNSSQENITGVIDTTGLGDGEHIVYLQSTDTAGNAGVISAEFLYVIDIATSPQISGVVTAAGTGMPLEATINAGPFSATSDPATGSYTVFAAAGEYSVTATPVDSGFGPATIDTVTAIDGTTTTVNFSLFPFCDVFADDVENGTAGWTTTGSWARTEETSMSPTFSWTDSPGGNYSNNQNVTLTSPGIDLSDITAAELNFAQICDTEAAYDFCIVEVTGNGSTWSEIARYDQSSGTSWNTRTLDVSQLAGSANARIRFRLDTDFSVLEDGWHIDDVAIRTSGAQCVAAVDSDSDGVFDDTDNCTLIANAAQLDVDGDGYGNICDADFDDNGVTNFLDLIIFADAFLQVGSLETDLNGDGATNFLDLTMFSNMYLQPPGPSGAVAP